MVGSAALAAAAELALAGTRAAGVKVSAAMAERLRAVRLLATLLPSALLAQVSLVIRPPAVPAELLMVDLRTWVDLVLPATAAAWEARQGLPQAGPVGLVLEADHFQTAA